MAIPYAQLRSLTARELISALLRDGFTLDRQAGSHRHYYQPDGRRLRFHSIALGKPSEERHCGP